jgi:hypothetical protein
VAPFDGRMAHMALFDKALEASRILDRYQSVGDVPPAELSGAALGHILDGISWPAGLRSIDTGLFPIVEDVATGPVLPLLQTICEDSEGGLFYVSGAGALTMLDRSTILSKVSSLATFGDASGEVAYADIELRYDDADLYSRVSVSRDGGDPQVAWSSSAEGSFGPRDLEREARRVDTVAV